MRRLTTVLLIVFMLASVGLGAYQTSLLPVENCFQIRMDDTAASTAVATNETGIAGVLTGTTGAVSSAPMANGIRGLHFDGTNDALNVAIPKLFPSALQNKWTKYNSGVPILASSKYGQLCRGSGATGDKWRFYGVYTATNNAKAWKSDDLITWVDIDTMLVGGSMAVSYTPDHLSAGIVENDTFTLTLSGQDAVTVTADADDVVADIVGKLQAAWAAKGTPWNAITATM
jgi:hypothetical protein